jgi:cell division protein FtsB
MFGTSKLQKENDVLKEENERLKKKMRDLKKKIGLFVLKDTL